MLKALGSCSYFWNHCSLVRGYFLGSTEFFCWPLLNGKRRILRLCFFNWISNCRSHFILSRRKVRGSYGGRVEYIFRFPQLRRSLNPISVKGFIPSLGAVNTTHSWDPYPKGFLGLSYSKVVTLLLSLIPNLLGLNPCLFSFSLGLFSLIFKPLGFFQFFLSAAICSLAVVS